MSWRWPSADVSGELKRLESVLRDHAGYLEVLIAAADVKSLDAETEKKLRGANADMLAACEAAEKVMVKEGYFGGVVDQLRAAIEKARGQ